jgi:transcriptional regulator with XRE-family HTH domain
MMTLGSELSAMRHARHLTLMTIAERCDLTIRPVWNAENDKLTKWETVHLILAVGMKVRPGSPEYATCHQLWLEARQRNADAKPKEKGKKVAPAHENNAVLAFRRLIKGMSEAETKEFLKRVKGIAKRMVA